MNKFIKHTTVAAGWEIISTTCVFAAMTVDTKEGILNVECDWEGTVVAKIVAPDDTLIVNERYEGNQFTWIPEPQKMDGAYRYDVRVVIPPAEGEEEAETVSEYAGGSVEVRNGEIINPSMFQGEEQ